MKKFLLVAGLSFGLIGAAYAGGAFQGYPLVGGDGASNCLSAGNNGVCNQYQPAGPSTLVPGATIPADTNVQGAGVNSNPATVALPAALTGATSIAAAPLTGTTINAADTAKLMLNPAGTIAALTVLMPKPTNGQTFVIYTTQTVTALTLTPSTGTTITPSITTVTAAAPVKLIFNAGSNAWVTQ